MGLGNTLLLLENTLIQKMDLLSLSTAVPPKTTMPSVSTVTVSHTALLLNEILQNSLSSLFLHWVGHRSYTPVKLPGGCETTSL